MSPRCFRSRSGPGRRRTLLAMAGLVGAFAGCIGTTDGDADDTTTDRDDSSPTETETESGTGPDTATLDLREANVTGVDIAAVESSGSDDRYRLSVSLYHDDDGEEGYANWWQAEMLDGERLGRRSLAHPHGTREFTRSETMTVSVDRTVVRGHDQTHGYGGQAAIVSIPDGAVTLVRQGSDPQSFEDR